MQTDNPLAPPPAAFSSARDWILAGLALLFIVAVTLAAPGGLLDKADKVGYAVCHQISVRSYFFGDRQMPLCARCTGQYLGAFFGLMAFLAVRRGRAAEFPAPSVLVLLALFLGVWAFDGANSYLTFFPDLPHLYEPRNILRLSTGMLQGIAVISLVLPVFNITVWRDPERQPAVHNLRELAGLVLLGAVLVFAVQSEWYPIMLPLALVSVSGTLILLTLVMTVVAMLLLRREGTVTHWRQLVVPMLLGLAGSLVLISLIDTGRSALSAALGLPF